MKKISNIFSVIFLLVFLILSSSCTPTTGGNTDIDEPPVDGVSIVITPKEEVINIKDIDVEDFNYTTYFSITEDDVEVEVKESYIDSTKVSKKPGEYNVICKYKGIVGKIKVVVTETVYKLDLSVKEVSINLNSLDEYDFNKLFTAYIDDEIIEITSNMINTNLENQIGEYYYTVTLNNISKTLHISVTDEYVIEILETYKDLKLSIDELKAFDYTTLFSVYVEGEGVKIENHMIDKSSINNPVVGNIYQVSISYTKGSSTKQMSTNIEIVENAEVKITSRNEIIPPNGANVDLTKLFTITEGENKIPVTMDMITGSIDYTKVGNNVITIFYKNKTASANVEVKLGVIINYAKSDTIVIAKGTKQNDYSFISDFEVIINGIKFINVSESYLDTSNVDFNTPGTYTATLKLPYNDNKLGLSGVNFTYVEKTITYVVVENNYKIDVLNDVVELNPDVTSYDVYRNLKVSINGRNQTLTEIKEYVDIITCYVKTLSNPIDFNYSGMQEVLIAVYANGVDNDPIIVSYNVLIKSDLVITHVDKVIFVGENVFPKDLFTITEKGNNVEITFDMLSGRIDLFVPGSYEIVLEYKGIKESAKVIVFDNNIKGVYKTDLENLKDMYNSSYDEENPEPTTKVTDLIIDEFGNISFNGKNAEIVSAIDENTMILKYMSYYYTLYYDNGIILLDPDNSINLSYTTDKRPFVYFNTSMWELEDKLVVNQYSNHVLSTTIITYSLDCFKIKNILTNESLWYGLKIHLVDKTSSDTVYVVSFDKVTVEDGFSPSTGVNSYIIFQDVKYEFTMQSNTVGKINDKASGESYANKTFTGSVSGSPAEIRTDQFEGFTLFINGEFIFKLGSFELSNLANGGLNKENHTALFYEFEEEIYSYKFIFNLENNTFTYVEKDSNFGLYEYENMYIFIDGYGTGLINFNTKSYYKTQFTYEQNVNIIKGTYFNTKPTFTYGTGFEAYISPLLNVLTIKDISTNVIGAEFKNSKVLTGAIVNINSYQVGQDSDTVAKAELYKNIEIITKDGILNDTQKSKLIDTSRIRFSTPGFYQFSITVNVNGQDVVQYYGVEVLRSIYESSPIVNTYGNGVIYNNNSLSIDKYGRVILNANGTVYNGTIKIREDNSFVINGINDKYLSITANGNLVADGIISLRCSGGITFSDYFTIGTTKVFGTNSFVVREFNISGNNIYILSNVATALGEIVEVELISGENLGISSIIKINFNNKEYFAKINSLNDTSNGLVLSDPYRGTYQNTNSANIVLDGFGNITNGTNKGTYTLNGSYVTASYSDFVELYKLDVETSTYSFVNIQLDNSLVNGKTFTLTYYYSCGSYLYTATTSFAFGDNNNVIITSSSPEHDSGIDACISDVYSPSFVSNNATYSVNGNVIKISSNGVSFEFKIVNLLNIDSITCIYSSLSSDAHGYFNVGSVYTIEIK